MNCLGNITDDKIHSTLVHIFSCYLDVKAGLGKKRFSFINLTPLCPSHSGFNYDNLFSYRPYGQLLVWLFQRLSSNIILPFNTLLRWMHTTLSQALSQDFLILKNWWELANKGHFVAFICSLRLPCLSMLASIQAHIHDQHIRCTVLLKFCARMHRNV